VLSYLDANSKEYASLSADSFLRGLNWLHYSEHIHCSYNTNMNIFALQRTFNIRLLISLKHHSDCHLCKVVWSNKRCLKDSITISAGYLNFPRSLSLCSACYLFCSSCWSLVHSFAFSSIYCFAFIFLPHSKDLQRIISSSLANSKRLNPHINCSPVISFFMCRSWLFHVFIDWFDPDFVMSLSFVNWNWHKQSSSAKFYEINRMWQDSFPNSQMIHIICLKLTPYCAMDPWLYFAPSPCNILPDSFLLDSLVCA
jgi:hypothetical protein